MKISSTIYKLFQNTRTESVYFFTFHKCASSLFSQYILRNINGLKQCDYASLIYDGGDFRNELRFQKTGCAYGPIRLSADPKSIVYSKLIKPTTDSQFLEDKKALFLIRDPRDILISEYYSFGFTHGLSSVKKIRKHQLEIRNDVKSKSLEEYIIERADTQVQHFQLLDQVSKSCKKSVVLKYEDMIDNFDYFIKQLGSLLQLSGEVEREIYKRSRPRTKEVEGSHRRSGQTRNFEKKLDAKTLNVLNKKLEVTLQQFGYEV